MKNRMLRVAAAIAAIGFVAACEAPTPTALNGVEPDVAAPSSDTPMQAPVAKREARQIVVEAGQSLSHIAVKYHVPQRAIIAANDLTAPYKIKIGQRLRIPSVGGPPPAPVVAGFTAPETIPLDPPALTGSTAPPSTAATASPVEPAPRPFEVAAPAGDKSPESSGAAVVPAPSASGSPPASSGSAEPPAPATTAAVSAPAPIPAAAPPGVTCPSGTIGMWSDRDVIKLPVYICRKPQSQS